MAKIVIVGAGLTGLAAAYYFEKRGIEFTIFEQNEHAAGLLQTVCVDGFWFDHTGHLMHVSDPMFQEFLQDCLGLENCNLLERRSYIYSHKTYVPYPFQQNLYGLPNQVIWECLDGFVKREQEIADPKSFAEFVAKYFGYGLAKHFFHPYNSKLLNQDPEKIMASWTQRFVPKTDLATMLKGAFFPLDLSSAGYNAKFYYPKEGGIGSLIAGILQKLKTPIQFGHQMIGVDVQKKIITFANGRTEQYDHLISTAALPVLLRSLDDAEQNWSALADNLKCNSVINFNLGFAKDHFLFHHWDYFPEKEFLFYRLGFWHNLASSMVPAGCSAIYGETSVLGDFSWQEVEQIAQRSIDQVLQFFKLEQSDVKVKKILFLKYAYVLYDQWREENLPNLLQCLADRQINSIGRFGAWKYSSMQEAVLEGHEIVEQISKVF